MNIFLLYTPFHAEYARSIIRQHFAGQENLLVNHYGADLEMQDGEKAEELMNIGGGLTKGFKGLLSVKRKMRSLLASGEDVNVLIPHTLPVLANYAFYRLSREFANLKVSIFYEGVIVFYNYRHGYAANLRYYVSRYLVSGMIGIRYVPERTLLDLSSKHIHKIYTPFPNLDAPAEKIVRTPLRQVDFQPEAGCGIVLGLILGKGQEEDLRRIIEAIYARVREIGLTKVYYKEHPLNKSPMFYEIAKKKGIRLTDIQDTGPIEKIIHRYKPSAVLSSWSSGLINLRNMLPGETGIYCFVTESITKGQEMNKLVNIFKAEGIKVEYV